MDRETILEKYSRFRVDRLRKIGQRIRPGKIVFFGDSLTEIFPLKKYFPEYDTFNSGISGNTTGDLLDRIDTSIYSFSPSAVVMLIGSNDVVNEIRDISYIVGNYRRLIEGMKEHGTDRILLQSCYPIHGEKAVFNREIVLLNQEIRNLAEEYGCLFADVHSVLTDHETGEMRKEYSRDGIHPNRAGYTKIADYLKEYLKKLVGPCV